MKTTISIEDETITVKRGRKKFVRPLTPEAKILFRFMGNLAWKNLTAAEREHKRRRHVRSLA